MADEEKQKQDNNEKNPLNPETEAPELGTEGGQKKTASSLKRYIIIGVGILVLIGVGIGAYLLLSKAPADKEDVARNIAPRPETLEFFDFPEILVNLRSETSQVRFLKADLVLEIGTKKDLEKVERLTPRIQDAFQVYLRELRPSDIRGPGSTDLIRRALITRANIVTDPIKIYNVLFKNFIVQ